MLVVHEEDLTPPLSLVSNCSQHLLQQLLQQQTRTAAHIPAEPQEVLDQEHRQEGAERQASSSRQQAGRRHQGEA
jgi:hypothetical protein